MRERSCLGGFFALSPGILTAFPSSMKNSRSKAGQTLGDAKCLWLAPSSLGWSSRETQFPIEPQVLTPQHLSDVKMTVSYRRNVEKPPIKILNDNATASGKACRRIARGSIRLT